MKVVKISSFLRELLNFLWYTRVCVRVWSEKYISFRWEGRNEGIKWWLVEDERCPRVKKTPPLLQAPILFLHFDVWYPYPRKKLSGLYHGYVHGCWTFQAALSQGSAQRRHNRKFRLAVSIQVHATFSFYECLHVLLSNLLFPRVLPSITRDLLWGPTFNGIRFCLNHL